MNFFIFLLLLPIFGSLYSHYYLYPVALLNHGKTILFIKQSCHNHIDVLLWNSETQQMNSCLWSLFNPAEIQVLPDESGFSFIDNGRLRIKYFNKRSPKTIDFDQYLYDIHNVHWINEHECYLSAKAAYNYAAIFHCTIDGMVSGISCGETDDNYPQKVDDQLFYIQKTKDQNYYVAQTLFSGSGETEHIMAFENHPIVFLKMSSLEQGFVISHEKTVKSNDERISFDYYRIKKEREGWTKKLLFSFYIPSYLLIKGNDLCLYESLLPLLPRHHGSLIYFVSSWSNSENKLEPFVFDMKRAKARKIKIQHKGGGQFYHIFVPFILNKVELVCGGNVL